MLTLSGVARVFQTKRPMLQSLDEFSRAWILLLEHIENSALSKNSEVNHSNFILFVCVIVEMYCIDIMLGFAGLIESVSRCSVNDD